MVEFWEEERGGIGHRLAYQGFPNLENGKRESVIPYSWENHPNTHNKY
jgi:hypothetical protein